MSGACSTYGGEKMRIQGFGGGPQAKRSLWRRRLRWDDNMKMDLQELGCAGMDWIELAQVRDRWRVLANAVMNRRIS